MSFFAIALVIGALLSGGRRMIGNRWFVAGAVIAVAFEVPDLWWQAQHGWATIAMTQALHRENGGLANIGTWVAGQLAVVTLALARVWVAGLRFLGGPAGRYGGRWPGRTDCCSCSSRSPPARRPTTWAPRTCTCSPPDSGYRRMATGPARPAA